MTRPRIRTDLAGAAYRRARTIGIAQSGGICLLCGQPIRLDLPGTHPQGPTLEHRIPVSRGGHPYHPANLSASHLSCNSRRGNRLLSELPPPPDTPSRDW